MQSRAPQVALAPQASAPVCASAAWPGDVSGHARVADAARRPARWRRGATRRSSPAAGSTRSAPTTEDCVTVDGVDWVVRPLTDGSAATTYGRDPAIEVLAPGVYGAVPLLLPAFTAVAKSLPANGRHCS